MSRIALLVLGFSTSSVCLCRFSKQQMQSDEHQRGCGRVAIVQDFGLHVDKKGKE